MKYSNLGNVHWREEARVILSESTLAVAILAEVLAHRHSVPEERNQIRGTVSRLKSKENFLYGNFVCYTQFAHIRTKWLPRENFGQNFRHATEI